MAKAKSGENANKKGLFYCAQEVTLAQEYVQETTPFCACAQVNQEVSCYQDTYNCKSALLLTKISEMDEENTQPPTKDSQVSLEELLEEVAMLETATNKPEKEKTPWWLSEESLLGEVELDYSTDNIPSTSKVKEEKKVNEYLTAKDSKPIMLEEKLLVKDNIKKAEVNKKVDNNTKAVHIPLKEMPQRGHATEDATLLEGLSAGAGTGEQGSNSAREEVREQSTGLCTVQMIRLVDNPPPPQANKVEQLWWVTPETEIKLKDLMEGDDVTQQRCTDCGFRGTKKRVKIHCMQHYCKYMCKCMLLKSSRDAIYDHQVSKSRTEEHGGADRRIYCVDRVSYPALCLAMNWEDHPPVGETRPNRRGG